MTLHPGPTPVHHRGDVGRPGWMPGVVTAGRVLLILSAVANGLLAVFAVGLSALASSMLSALSAGDADATAEGARLGVVMAVLAGWSVVVVVLEIGAAAGLRGSRRRGARLVATCLPIGDVAVGLVSAPVLGASVIVGTVFWSAVWVVLLVSLLWLPISARHYFAAPGPGTGLDAPTRPMLVAGPVSGGRWATAVVLVALGVTVIAAATVVATVVGRSTGGGTATVDPAALVSCAQSFEQEWGPGLASPAGERLTVAATGLAIANDSFDAPSDIPRRVLRTAYQTQDKAGNLLTVVADRHVRETTADPRFRSCHENAAAWQGDTSRVLQAFGCVSKPSSPVLLDCD